MQSLRSRRYTATERARILVAIERDGLMQIAAAKKYGVSAVTIWQWKRAAKKTRPRRARALRTNSPSGGSLDGLLRTQVRAHIERLLPQVVRDEVADYVQVLGPGK